MEYDGTNRYTCNSDGSLASVLAGDVALSYKYDALGRRVLKESSAADSVLYLYDQADRCIAEYTSPDDCATLACSAGYVYADADALGAPIAVEDSAGSYQYVATDPQGNVIYQTPSCSHIVLVKYDAYGNIYNTSAGDLNLPFRFAGMRYEKDTDIYLTPNRAYSPAIGRWLQPDPLGTLPNPKQGNGFSPLSQYTDGRNLYEYCAGDPVNERDMRGLTTLNLEGEFLLFDNGIYEYKIGIEFECKNGNVRLFGTPKFWGNAKNQFDTIGFKFYTWGYVSSLEYSSESKPCLKGSGMMEELDLSVIVKSKTTVSFAPWDFKLGDRLTFNIWEDYQGFLNLPTIILDCCKCHIQ